MSIYLIYYIYKTEYISLIKNIIYIDQSLKFFICLTILLFLFINLATLKNNYI